jgi:hypothetical protein
MFPASIKYIAFKLIYPASLSATLLISGLAFSNRQSFIYARSASPETQSTTEAKKGEKPVYHDYKGVSIGMPMEEARKKLGDTKDKSDAQDFWAFSEKESVSVYYDDAKKVMAVSVIYMGAQSGAPSPKDVLGIDVRANEDGSIHRVIRYPEAGFWISYARTAGSDPLISVTMQKIQ